MTGEGGLEIDALLGDFIDTYYVELMCLLPVTLMLAGLTYAVAADSYMRFGMSSWSKRTVPPSSRMLL